ncbi:MAG: phage tail protein [Roseibium sp.]|nr:phage tail protein [Roseibium sp.]
MGWGPFRFTVPTYSVEQLKRNTAARVQSAPVVGGRPITHLLGAGEETISLESTFFPHHLNKGGLSQLSGVRDAVTAQTPHLLVHVSGLVFGRWVATAVDEGQTTFAADGLPCEVTTTLELTRYISGGIPIGSGGTVPFVNVF